jgi:trehalose/maltose transport system substrate-binding protein
MAIALVLAGCPGKASRQDGTQRTFQQAVPAVPGANRAMAGTTIRYHAYAPGDAAKLDRALAEQFAKDTGITVEVTASTQTSDEIFQAYERLFATKQPDYDVLMLDVIWPGALAPHLRDLGPALRENAQGAFPQIVRNNTINGKLVAMPYYADAGMLFYRTDLLKQYGFDGPPATWEALERMAAAIQAGERQHTPDFAGFVWQGRVYEGLTCNALEWQASHGGGEIFHADTGSANVANPQAIAAFGRAAGWIGTISPREVLTYQEEDARKQFQAGKAAFMRNWPYAYAAGNDPTSAIKGRFEATTLPHAEGVEHGAAALGGWQLGVSAYSKKPGAAMAFVRYMASPGVQKWRAIEGAFLPTHRTVYDDAEVQAIGPFMATVPAVLEVAIARPSNRTQAQYGRVSHIYANGVSAILHGAAPGPTAQRMQRELQALIK